MIKQFWKHFAAAIAALSATATLLTVLFDLDGLKDKWVYGLIGTVIVIGGSVGYALWQIKSKKKISLTLSSELKLTVSEGDLFDKKGVICIPFNEYFDTHVGGGVISEKSLHGQFINRFLKTGWLSWLIRSTRVYLNQEGFNTNVVWQDAPI